MNLDDMYAPVKADLEKVEQSLESVAEVNISLLSKLLHYVVSNGGKRIRPAFTLLSGKFSNYDLSKLIPMAAAVELLHTATLVHDDIVDKSAVRRGKQSVSQAWGEASALLLGDYLFARAGSLVASTGNLRAVKLFAQTLMTISSGELAQIDVYANGLATFTYHYYCSGALKSFTIYEPHSKDAKQYKGRCLEYDENGKFIKEIEVTAQIVHGS